MQVEMLAEVSTTLNANAAHRRFQSTFSAQCMAEQEGIHFYYNGYLLGIGSV